jgi:alcohol dehydrogenase class IV
VRARPCRPRPRPRHGLSGLRRKCGRNYGGGHLVTGDFTWIDGERLIRFGGALGDAPGLLAGRGFEPYALLTTPRAAVAAPALVEGADVVRDVPSGGVPEAAAAVRGGVEGRPLVALGGGRVIDAAKGIGGADGLPVASVPTTLSGAEMTPFHRMPAGVEKFRLIRPSLVIADPALMASQPMPDLAASAMNALAHAVEALYTPLANPVAEMAAVRAAESIARGLEPAEPDRTALALGALLAGYASGLTGFAVHHAVCQTIVRVCGTPHAQTNSVMLPHFVRFMESRAPREIGLLGEALGMDVSGLAARAGVSTLGELGVTEADLPGITEAVAQRGDIAANTPGAPSADEIREVIEQAL